MEEEGAETVVKCAKDALGTPILLRSIWAGKTKKNSTFTEKSSFGEVVELATIVSLDSENRALKLSGDIGMKVAKNIVNFRHAAQRKRPCVMGKILKYDEIIFVMGNTQNRRRPYIAMK